MEALTPDQKAEIDATAKKNMNFCEKEYWRVRNGKSRFMRCPYCATPPFYRRNFVNGKKVCCALFAKAFEAILDRQDEVDKAQAAAQTIVRLGKMVEHGPN